MRGSDTMGQDAVQVSAEERAAMRYVEELKGFYHHVASYVVVICGLFVINYLSNPEYIWAWWPTLGWGLGLASHAVRVFQPFKLFGPEWERRQIREAAGAQVVTSFAGKQGT